MTREFGHEHHANALGLLAFVQQLSAIATPPLRDLIWNLEIIDVHVRGFSFYIFGVLVVLSAIPASFAKFPQLENIVTASTQALSSDIEDAAPKLRENSSQRITILAEQREFEDFEDMDEFADNNVEDEASSIFDAFSVNDNNSQNSNNHNKNLYNVVGRQPRTDNNLEASLLNNRT